MMASKPRFVLVVVLLGLFGLILPSAVLADCTTVAGNIIASANCGFETGDFTSWTQVPAGSGSDFGVAGVDPHSGTYAAYFGSTGGNDYIYQNLATTSGTVYDVNFWVDGSQQANGQFVALWNGTPFFTLVGPNNGYTDYEFFASATSGSSQLELGGNTPPGHYFLDDVSVAPTALSATPEPSAIFLFVTGLMAIGGSIKRKILS